jgi:hypothetical protein
MNTRLKKWKETTRRILSLERRSAARTAINKKRIAGALNSKRRKRQGDRDCSRIRSICGGYTRRHKWNNLVDSTSDNPVFGHIYLHWYSDGKGG